MKAPTTSPQPLKAGVVIVVASFATTPFTSYPSGIDTSEREGIATPYEVHTVMPRAPVMYSINVQASFGFGESFPIAYAAVNASDPACLALGSGPLIIAS